jgi:hypothetical protein
MTATALAIARLALRREATVTDAAVAIALAEERLAAVLTLTGGAGVSGYHQRNPHASTAAGAGAAAGGGLVGLATECLGFRVAANDELFIELRYRAPHAEQRFRLFYADLLEFIRAYSAPATDPRQEDGSPYYENISSEYGGFVRLSESLYSERPALFRDEMQGAEVWDWSGFDDSGAGDDGFYA